MAITGSTSFGGSPAWAGIDRTCSWRRSRPRWLPRVGGDRPFSTPSTPASSSAPPLGRGLVSMAIENVALLAIENVALRGLTCGGSIHVK